jgi:aldose 1-epimerase
LHEAALFGHLIARPDTAGAPEDRLLKKWGKRSMKRVSRYLAVLIMLLSAPGLALAQARYTVRTTGDVVQLRDARADVVISVLTPVSNAYEMVVKGENVIRMPIKSVDEMRARPGLNGIPLLAPFANRLDDTYFYANGKKYNFDTENGTVRGPVPIHGYLTGASAWKVVEAKADADGAWLTTKLEFYKNPLYMQNFPFAHVLTMTYRLSNGEMEVHTKIENLSIEPMPVAIGFHPYFQLTDSVRNDWVLNVPAATHWKLADNKVPTGETEPADLFWGGDRRAVPMSRFANRLIDDVFTDLERDARGRATVSVKGKSQTLAVTLGPKFKTILVYSTVAPPPPPNPNAPPRPPQAAAPAPPPVSTGPAIPLSAKDQSPAPLARGFVAFEPMAGITNSMNAAQKGQYKDLQSIPPGGTWEESFWVRATGY